MTITIYKVNHQPYEVNHPDKEPTLKWLQNEVEGNIEIVHLNLGDGIKRQLIVDEEGLLKGKPINWMASGLYVRTGLNNGHGHAEALEWPIVGDAVLLEGEHLCK